MRHKDQIPLVLSETSGITTEGIGWPGAKTGKLVVSARTRSSSRDMSVAPGLSASLRLNTADGHMSPFGQRRSCPTAIGLTDAPADSWLRRKPRVSLSVQY